MKKKLVSVIDDEVFNLSLIRGLLMDLYEVALFNDAQSFVDAFKEGHTPDIILLDLVMPGVDGFELIKKINQDMPCDTFIPIIFITGQTSVETETNAFQMGASDYITKPFSPIVLIERIRLHLDLKSARDLLANQNQYLNEEVKKRTSALDKIQDITLTVIAHIVEKRDQDTGDHIARTRDIVRLVGSNLIKENHFKGKLDEQLNEQYAKASILHDIGKVGIPDYILQKPGRFTDEERQIMQEHSRYGAEAIDEAINQIAVNSNDSQADIDFVKSFYLIARNIAMYHHEKYDGTGYPEGLKGENIPLAARIMAIADVFDALVSKRVYKDAWDFKDAITHIQSQKGLHFDPVVVDAFIASIEDIKKLYKKM